ncbi:MAG: DNA replication/repair protein RecF [Alphaproteobacteria bacterium]|nr:DNA replication/repair protein RecF [Alphaproteobacteria bacterium]
MPSATTDSLAVRRLQLTDFRNYATLRLSFEATSVVLTGPNGAGKTNLLEALSLLVPGRGLRRARIAALARQEAQPGLWAVAVGVRTPAGAVEVGVGRDPKGMEGGRDRRLLRINGRDSRSQAALGEVLHATWLTPEMDRLFLEGPSGRRRFLDRLAFGFEPAHATRLADYGRAMRERSRLLQEGPADPGWLDALEETMAESGVAIAETRRAYVRHLGKAVAEATGPFPGVALETEGLLEAGLATETPAAMLARYRSRLADLRRRDAEAGLATEGPHRSDLAVRHGTKGMPAADCSTGEQKALLIAILLADARLQRVARGTPPLLLLDEVTAHLDSARRQALFEAIETLGAQAWMTGTEAALFQSLKGRAQFFRVLDGAAVAEA